MDNNICLMSDSYKMGHYQDYPDGLTFLSSYLESRGGIADETIFCGLQYYLKKYLVGKVVTQEMIEEAEPIVNAHMGPGVFNRAGWEHIVNNHGGKLPIEIRAVPEGTRVSAHNVLMTIKNTDPKCAWLTNFLETLLLKVWYPITVASLSYEIKKIILEYLELTGDPSLVDYKLHDFGYRGVSSEESAGLGSFAHLLNFSGGDTFAGIQMVRKYYNENGMPCHSIFATEHSIICSFGPDGEENAYRQFLERHPTGIIACVSDTYDIYNACENLWGGSLRDKVNAREGTLVIRPDSGDPVTVINRVLEILGEKFGSEINQKGYRVLSPKVRVIQGDGVNQHSIRSILSSMKKNSWSADNIAFGMGGALLQQLNRDTFKFATKASYVEFADGTSREIYKNPSSDTGKASKAGQLALTYTPTGGFRTVKKKPNQAYFGDHLRVVFVDGELWCDDSLQDLRDRVLQRDYSSPVKMTAKEM